jgi:hypothetical protein
MPVITNNDYLFGIGTAPSDAGKVTAPVGFSKEPEKQQQAPTGHKKEGGLR